jgi:hypothetical protein
LILIDEVSASFRLLALAKLLSDGQNPATRPVLSFKNGHSRSASLQFKSGCQAGQAGSYDNDRPATKAVVSDHTIPY